MKVNLNSHAKDGSRGHRKVKVSSLTSTLLGMASNLRAMACNLVAMAFNPISSDGLQPNSELLYAKDINPERPPQNGAIPWCLIPQLDEKQ